MKLEETDTAVLLHPQRPADASVIWLHGLGADGYDFVPAIEELRLPAQASIRFILPHAPVRPVTLNGGMRMRAWYDILGLDRSLPQDEAGIRASAASIDALVAAERAAGIDSRRILLAGFSQGGAIALHVGVRHPESLAGVLALSTYLPLSATVAAERSPQNQATPILICHGRFDPVLPLAFGEAARDTLLGLDYAIEWREYPMQHQVCAPELDDISAWLAARFA
jgi:phospholipase/carboxylesterase